MRLILALEPSELEFTEPSAGGALPYLADAGELHEQARAGYITGLGIGETPSLVLTLTNHGRRVAGIIRQPLRARADFYDDAGRLRFSGLVASIAYGRTITLTIDA